MSTLKVDAIRHNSATSDAITLASDASNISIGSSVFHGIKSTIVTNGDFSNGTTNWTASGSSIAVSSGVLTLTPNSGVNGFAYQAITTVVGKYYNVQVDVTQDAGSLARLYVGTSATGNQNVYTLNLGVGTHSSSFKATATTHYVSLVVGGGTGQATKFDNVRVIESNSISFSTGSVGHSPSLRPWGFDGMSLTAGGADRLIVTKDGIVRKPNHPAFAAKGVGGSWVTLAGSGNGTYSLGNAAHSGSNYNTNLNWASNNNSGGTHSTGGCWDNTGARFLAPVDGFYYFDINLYVKYSGQKTLHMMPYTANTFTGTYDSSISTVVGGSSAYIHYPRTNRSICLYMLEGRHFEWKIYSETSIDVYPNYCWQSGFLIS